MGPTLLQSLFPNVIMWPAWQFPGKPCSQGLSLFDLRTHPVQTILSQGTLTENYQQQLQTSQLPEVVITAGANNKLTRGLKGKTGMRCPQRTPQTSNIFLGTYKSVQCRAVCTPRRDLRRPDPGTYGQPRGSGKAGVVSCLAESVGTSQQRAAQQRLRNLPVPGI